MATTYIMIIKKFFLWIVLLGLCLTFVNKIYATDLGQADSFSILSSTYTNTSIGTNISGDVGYTTRPAVTPIINGITYTPPSNKYTTAGIDQGSFLGNLNSQPCTFNYGSATNLSLLSQPLTPGVYCITGATSVGTAGITLTDGTYIFRIDGALTTVANSVVNGSACNVFWTPTQATTLGANSTFLGTDIDASGITIGSNVKWSGRALAFGGTVSTDKDIITTPNCSGITPIFTQPIQNSTSINSSNTSNQNQTPVCIDNNTIKLPANPHIIRQGSDATVKWVQTEGNKTNIYYRQLNEINWTHAVGDIDSNGYMSYTIHQLKPKVGYVFGIEQKWNCSGGQMVTAVIIDDWKPNLFKFSYWEWSK